MNSSSNCTFALALHSLSYNIFVQLRHQNPCQGTGFLAAGVGDAVFRLRRHSTFAALPWLLAKRSALLEHGQSTLRKHIRLSQHRRCRLREDLRPGKLGHLRCDIGVTD